MARRHFTKTGKLVASSNIIRVALIRRFDITSRYREGSIGVLHSTLTFNQKATS